MQSTAMVNFTTCSILIFSVLITILLPLCCCQKAYPNVSCIARERRALLQLRSSLVDKSNRLSSWSGEDCCKWKGVGCSKTTGHVVNLDLHNPIPYDDERYYEDPKYSASYRNNFLAGEINPSILALKHLNYLDLSFSNFSGRQIPVLFGSLKNLKYLNLSHSGFEGEIPYHLGNLSHLQHLDLSSPCTSKSLSWISKLHSLKSLDLSFVNLSEAQDWFQAINMLPSLMFLKLVGCQLHSLPSVRHVNLTSLTSLDLRENYFNSTIPLWLFNITSLMHLNLCFNNFHGPIPDTISQMNSLISLYLSANQLTNPLPNSFNALSRLVELSLEANNFQGPLHLGPLSNLTSLKGLALGSNKFHGAIPREIGYLRQLAQLQLSWNKLNGSISPNFWLLRNLEYLNIGYNSLIGEISEKHFAELQKLKILALSSNSLTLSVRSSWIPPFQLRMLQLDNFKIGPQFPLWLETQKNLELLSMRNANISDNIPDWFEIVHSRIHILDLSFNNITGKVPKFQIGNTSLSSDIDASRRIILAFNKFEGVSEQFPSDIQLLYIAYNALDGGIPIPEDSTGPVSWKELSLNDNHFNGSIPESICRIRDLELLDLSNNQLSGRLPLCLGNLRDLRWLNLANNSLCGQIPSSLGYIEFLQSLHLNNNKFHGELPLSLQYLKQMRFLDLGKNELEGIIPSWIGKGLSNMRILRLKSNNFYGDVSLHLCQLSKLRVLDLAQNNLTGRIPRCFNNFSAMVWLNYSLEDVNYMDARGEFIRGPVEYLVSFMGGRELEFSTNFQKLRSLDLSENHMVGEIPNELMDLLGLQSLTLSRNHLSGTIPEKIGNLKQLSSLDLSMNELSGSIPPSLANLNFLSYLNLSSNKLSGPIPTGNQLQTLTDPSIYAGNSGLCGKPLSNRCSNEKSSQERGPTLENKGDKGTSLPWFFAGLGPGFGFGFLGIFSILLLKQSWRHAYFQFVENFSNNIWVWIALKALKLQRKLQ